MLSSICWKFCTVPWPRVDVVQARELDEPDDVVAEDPVVEDPRRERVPLRGAAAVDGYAVLGHLILRRLEIGDDLLRHLGQEPPSDQVILLDENLAEPGLSARVVLEVKPVEPVERVLVRVHVQRVDVEVVGAQVDALENLAKVEKFAVAIDDLLVRLALQLRLDETQQVLLVHARAVVHVGVNLTNVVEIAVRRLLLRHKLLSALSMTCSENFCSVRLSLLWQNDLLGP